MTTLLWTVWSIYIVIGVGLACILKYLGGPYFTVGMFAKTALLWPLDVYYLAKTWL
jgi:hypothetical protein